jgi:Zn-dependent oligopeptidase
MAYPMILLYLKFIAEDIAALLCNLPLPAAGEIPGMTVNEAKQVFHVIQHNMLHNMLCNMLCNIHDT